MPCQRSRDLVGGLGGHVSGPPSCTATRATTTPLPAGATRTRDHPADRSAPNGVQPAAGPPSLRGGAVAGVAGGLPAAAGPLRAARRHPDGVPAAGLRADLPQHLAAVEGITPAIRRRLGPGGWG